MWLAVDANEGYVFFLFLCQSFAFNFMDNLAPEDFMPDGSR
jgi:hypothetical protein